MVRYVSSAKIRRDTCSDMDFMTRLIIHYSAKRLTAAIKRLTLPKFIAVSCAVVCKQAPSIHLLGLSIHLTRLVNKMN